MQVWSRTEPRCFSHSRQARPPVLLQATDLCPLRLELSLLSMSSHMKWIGALAHSSPQWQSGRRFGSAPWTMRQAACHLQWPGQLEQPKTGP